MIFTLEVLTTIASLCSAPQFPHIQYTCERMTIHCITNSKPDEKDGLTKTIVSASLVAKCFTEDRGK